MIKRIFSCIAATLFCALLFSCAASETSSVSFSVPADFARSIKESSAGDWTLDVELSGDLNLLKQFSITEPKNGSAEPAVFTIEDLKSGSRLEVNVKILNGKLAKYKNIQPYYVELEPGANSLDVELERIKKDAEIAGIEAKNFSICVKNGSVSDGNVPELTYENKIIEFSLLCEKEFDFDSYSYSWYMNGEEIVPAKDNPSFELNLMQNDDVVLTEKGGEQKNNSLTCFISSGEELIEIEYIFVLNENS
ncbi:MAG: hypothetical protein PUD00_07165 [Treponema berlinense]|uniref:hypothetical protein n=1 Tax=Treponema berlinense TaxID=225004 RepID=UPI0023F535C3|nr:hypothetical protein [Treponema berlinense]MDD5834993.1 hypothetical protein [Treponema berlinense]